MKSFITAFFCMTAISIGFSQESIHVVIINPDMKAEFPGKPTYFASDSTHEKYELTLKDEFISISSEPYPINYKGKTIHQAESEFYPTFNQRLIGNRNIKSLIQKDTTFDGQKSRELNFIEILPNKKEEFVFIKAIMVSGFKEALYIITIKNLSSFTSLPPNGKAFLNSLDLYYLLEHKVAEKSDKKAIKILEKEGFKIEK